MRMTKQETLDHIALLQRDRSLWSRERDGDRLMATLDNGLTITIDGACIGRAMWMAEHERYGVLVAWTPTSSLYQAFTDATDYARSHVMGLHEPQHAG